MINYFLMTYNINNVILTTPGIFSVTAAGAVAVHKAPSSIAALGGFLLACEILIIFIVLFLKSLKEDKQN